MCAVWGVVISCMWLRFWGPQVKNSPLPPWFWLGLPAASSLLPTIADSGQNENPVKEGVDIQTFLANRGQEEPELSDAYSGSL